MSTPPAPLLAPAVAFRWPDHTAYGRRVAKERILARAKARGLRARLTQEVDAIDWTHVLAPRTLQLPATTAVQELAVLRVTLKPGVAAVSESVLRAIDQAILLPIVFEVAAGAVLQTAALFKRPSLADASQSVLGDYLWGAPLPVGAARAPLPTALDLGALYESLLRQLAPIVARPQEALPDVLARLQRARQLDAECARLAQRLAKERQFNRKVDINHALRAAQQALRVETAT